MNEELSPRQRASTTSEWIDVPVPPTDLPYDDGEPLESNWHRLAMNLLIESLGYYWRDRQDFFVGGNMFIYFSQTQIRNKDYRGPDFFFVWDVERSRERHYWALWDEDGKAPNVIIELTSPKTAKEDRTTKKRIYERTLKTPEYFLYDPATEQFEAWRLGNGGRNGRYQPIAPDERGWFWSKELELWLGNWSGKYLETPGIYPRFYDQEGKLVLIGGEAERQRAQEALQQTEAERQRAEAAETELARLKARLAELEAGPTKARKPTSRRKRGPDRPRP